MAKVMSFGVWCLTHKIFSSVNFASGEAAMLLSLSVFVGIIANLGVFFRIDGLRPLQNSFPSRQLTPKHRFSAVFVSNIH
ncbi:PilS protein [Neisseria meningitidis]|nr:PilS protein [Neisseria meningitidis]